MAETISWCTMIDTVFYISALYYFISLWFMKNISPIDKEFATVVVLGLMLISTNISRGRK